ncbi:uncharacterized protein C8A04DRAFT_28112 [Dichotomopilus funicola]|uniref:Uncharacterized protein n=1 Tax=Dichotomopilus funicola TaxID=1934379 RepID=A0AAN6V527_9PEZI|nr:hypothetical protein C8A04DRAFT_28112 [Dichotomopilus funicola]
MSSSGVPNPLGGLPSRVAPAKKQTVDSSWPLAKDTAAASASASTSTATGKKKQQRGQDTDVPPPLNTASTSKKAAQTAAAASSSEVPPPPPARGLPSEKKKKTTTAASRFPIIEDEIPIMMDLPSTTKKPAKPQQLPPLSMKDLPSSASLPRSAVAPTKEVPPTTFPDPSMPKPLRLGGQKTDKSAVGGAAGGAQKLSDLPEQPGPAPSGSLPTPSSRSAGKKKVTIADVPDQDLPQTQPLRLANATFKPPGNGAATAAAGQTDLKLDTKLEGKVGRKAVGTAAGGATLDTPVKSSTRGGKAGKAAAGVVDPVDPFNPAPLDTKTAGGKAGKARGLAGAVDPVDPFNPAPLDTKMAGAKATLDTPVKSSTKGGKAKAANTSANVVEPFDPFQQALLDSKTAGGKSALDTQPKSSTKGNKTKVTTGSVGYVDPFNLASLDPKAAGGKPGKAGKAAAGAVDPVDPFNPAPLDTKTPGAKATKANPFRLDPMSATSQATSAQAIPSGSGTGSGPFTRKPLGSPPRTAMQKTPPLGGFPAFPAGTQSKAGQAGAKGSKNPFRPLQGDSQQPQQMGNVATYDDPFGQAAADAYTQQQQDQLQGKPLGQTGAQSVYRPSAVSPPPPAARGTQRTAAGKPGFGHAPSSSLDSNDSMGSSATATSSSRPLNGAAATQRGNTAGTYGNPVGGGGYNQAQAVPSQQQQQQPYRQQQTSTFNQPSTKQPPPPARTRTDEKPYYPNNEPPSEGQTPYMNMLLSLDRIPRLHNILVSFFVWILLAGFIILPGSFTSTKRKEDNATVQIPIGGTGSSSTSTGGNKAATGGGKLSLTPANTAALVIGFLCLLAGTFGSAWLGLRWRRNYVWLLNKLYMPLTLTCIAGLIATITAVYTQQAGEWGPQAVTTAVVEAVELAISLGLFFIYNYWLLKRVRGEHVDSYDDGDMKGMSKKEMRAEKKRRRKEKKAARKAAKGKGRWGSGFFARLRGVRRKKPYAAGSIV